MSIKGINHRDTEAQLNALSCASVVNSHRIFTRVHTALNYPARLATMLVAGLPLIQRENGGAVFATQSLARERDVGLFFTDAAQLAEQLYDRERMAELRGNVWRQREEFTFDYHADRLTEFFRQVIGRDSDRVS